MHASFFKAASNNLDLCDFPEIHPMNKCPPKTNKVDLALRDNPVYPYTIKIKANQLKMTMEYQEKKKTKNKKPGPNYKLLAAVKHYNSI